MAEIHWSEKATNVSPDKKWQIDVSPQGKDGPALVSIRGMLSKREHILFRLQRDASIVWKPDSTSFIVVDQAFSDHYRLMVFRMPFLDEHEKEGLQVDRTVRAAVDRNLSPSDRINYYLPEVIG